jgi:hypothetical protein
VEVRVLSWAPLFPEQLSLSNIADDDRVPAVIRFAYHGFGV